MIHAMIDGNFGSVSAGVLILKVAYQVHCELACSRVRIVERSAKNEERKRRGESLEQANCEQSLVCC